MKQYQKLAFFAMLIFLVSGEEIAASAHFWEVDLTHLVFNFTVSLKWETYDDLDLYLFESGSDIRNFDNAVAYSLQRESHEKLIYNPQLQVKYYIQVVVYKAVFPQIEYELIVQYDTSSKDSYQFTATKKLISMADPEYEKIIQWNQDNWVKTVDKSNGSSNESTEETGLSTGGLIAIVVCSCVFVLVIITIFVYKICKRKSETEQQDGNKKQQVKQNSQDNQKEKEQNVENHAKLKGSVISKNDLYNDNKKPIEEAQKQIESSSKIRETSEENVSESQMCMICRSEGSNAILPCSHIFHNFCIVEWLRKDLYCPVCRRGTNYYAIAPY